MIHYERTLDINSNPQAIWDVIGRFMHIDEFAPLVKSVESITDGGYGIRSKRRCNFEDGSSVVEEVTKWKPNIGYRVSLIEMSSMPLKEAYSEISIEMLDNGKTRVKWSMEYRVKFGLFGWLLGQTMMKLMMGKTLDGNLKGLAGMVL